jgi:hypothetical protein
VLASRVTVRVRGWGVAYPLPLCWHCTVPGAALRHLRRDATPVRRHMTPTDVNTDSTQCHKRNAFKRVYCAGQHTIRFVGYCCAIRPQALFYFEGYSKRKLYCVGQGSPTPFDQVTPLSIDGWWPHVNLKPRLSLIIV